MTALKPAKTLRVRSPEDLLAVVPYSFGFHPTDSLVVVTGEGAQQFHARTDLPVDPLDPEVDAMCDYIASVVERHQVSLVLVVLYTDDEVLADVVHDELVEQLEEVGCRVGWALRAHAGRWWSLTDCPEDDEPVEGVPYDLSGHEFDDHAVLEGQVTHGSREELAASLVGDDPADLELVQAAVQQAIRRLAGAGRSPFGPVIRDGTRRHLVKEGHWVEDRVRRFLDDGERLVADEIGRLLVALVSIEVRDVAWSQMCRANAAQHVDLWRDVVRRTPEDLMPAPAALLAFAAWLSGHGALAWCALDRCQDADPEYGLAGLLTQALAGAVPPTAWQPVPREALGLFAD